MATLKDVAAATGVHYTVASSILNGAKGNSRYSAATRQAVERAAKRLGYTRNEHASGLRARSTRAVGLVAGNICNPFFAALATALEKHLRDAGHSLLLATHGHESWRDEESLIRSLLGKSVGAVLVWSEGVPRMKAQALRRLGKPIIWLGTPHAGEWSVEVDIEAGLTLAVEDLQRRGHRRVAWYGPRRSLEIGLPKPRAAIFEQIAKRAGLERALVVTYEGEAWDVAAAGKGAQAARLRIADEKISAVIGYNDVAALGCLMSPGGAEMEVVGFDGTDWIKSWTPAVRYVDLGIDAVAAGAVTLALQAMSQKPGRPQRLLVPPAFAAAGTHFK